MGEFDGLTAVVTGGASGIGLATAQLLAASGANVAILDRKVDDAPTGLYALECDVTDSDAVTTAVNAVADRFGGLDIVVNNAGIGAAGAIEDNPDTEFVRPREIRVEWQLWEDDAGVFHQQPPKDDSYRDLDLPPWLAQLIGSHLARTKPEPCACHGRRYVFRAQRSAHPRRSSFSDWIFDPAATGWFHRGGAGFRSVRSRSQRIRGPAGSSAAGATPKGRPPAGRRSPPCSPRTA
jgi:NAD(P)-dependent dehydrogenase (short-subunit alcohol dehydrogenase family)